MKILPVLSGLYAEVITWLVGPRLRGKGAVRCGTGEGFEVESNKGVQYLFRSRIKSVVRLY